MALIIEVFKRTIDLELAYMGLPDSSPERQLFMLGAKQALEWIRDGKAKPSEVLAEVERSGVQLQ